MSYNFTNHLNVNVRTNMKNWLDGDPPSCIGKTLSSTDGSDIALKGRLLVKAVELSEEIKKPEALKHACSLLNSLKSTDDASVEMHDVAKQVAPFKAKDIRFQVKVAPDGFYRGMWEAALEVTCTDALGKKVVSYLPFQRISWDKWQWGTNALEYASMLPVTHRLLADDFQHALKNLRRPSDVANAAIRSIADSEGCAVSRNGNTWTLVSPTGAGYESTSKIAERTRRSLINFCPTWSVDVHRSVPGVNDIEFLCESVNSLLDDAECAVKEIDEMGYHEYEKYAFKEGQAKKLTGILEQASRFRKSVADLSDRLETTHDRMTQVMGNAKSVSQGNTSHLFD